jgi:hypothetical protein
MPPMTRDQMIERIHKIAEHFGFGPGVNITVDEFIEMVIEYDEVEPLSDEEAEYFSRTLTRGFLGLAQKRQAELS